MSLDDALFDFDRREHLRGISEEGNERDRRSRLQRFANLVEEFCQRMAAVGNPGMDWRRKNGLFNAPVTGWNLVYDETEKASCLQITDKGLVVAVGPATHYKYLYVRPLDIDFTLRDDQLKILGRSMARVMRQHRVP
jgi:hypothetical protein